MPSVIEGLWPPSWPSGAKRRRCGRRGAVVNLLTLVLALALVGGQTSAKPNFAGEWKMNAAKSNFGVLPPPDSMTRSITHAEPALTIVEKQQSAMGDQNTTRKYTTDGSPISFEVNGATVKGSAKWAGATLEVESYVEMIGTTFADKMTLSPDGKTLTSQVHISSPQGDIDITVVFDKQ
jgi:hypothetical protein